MPPPRVPAKRDATPATPTSSPGTPSASPGTPAESEEPKKKKPRKNAEEQTPLTAVQKAKDMCTKLLKKERRGNPEPDTPTFALCRSIEQRDGEVCCAV